MAMMKFYKYQGAGNDFLIADNRDGHIIEKEGVLTAVLEDGTVWSRAIADLCDRRYGIGADGLMLLSPGTPQSDCMPATDFQMVYFNSDGSGGMMCGNGGRCIVAFAYDCGVSGVSDEKGARKYVFTAADGLHEAYVLDETPAEKTIRLKMKDVDSYESYDHLEGVQVPSDGFFLDTGTRHYVRFVDNLEEYDVFSEGREIRYKATELQPVGANVNFVEPCDGLLKIRTYEKGVEDETYACGTGIVASTLASYVKGVKPHSLDHEGRAYYDVKAKKDRLAVDFLPSDSAFAKDVFLTGPAVFVCEILI
jgi:diaminopimelate epimerase